MHFDLPPDRILPVHAVSVRLDPAQHPFEVVNGAAIDEHWRDASARNPALFDGKVALLSSLGWRDGVLEGRSHLVRYATLLYWRDNGPTAQAGHMYTHAMLVGSDNALLAARMAPTTANAGLVYFAAGSFELDDFPGGVADPEFNMHREVAEETGLALAGVRREPHYSVLSKSSGTVLFRRYFFDRTADELAAEVRAHVAAETDPEIVGPVVIRHAADLPAGLAQQMPDLIAWHFGMSSE